ncbi:MAG TPA: DNRLRE domain-containing protein, partial [Castellaniella sp.]|nr:DNRLRE domain-containing protein [Castellaniella sp.]
NNRVLVQFDRQALLQRVGSGTLRTAKLRLYIVANANNWGSSGRAVNVHRMTQAWSEQGATWNCADDANRFDSQADCSTGWKMASSSQWPFLATAASTLLHQNNQTGWVEWDVTTDAAQILAGSVPNYGWIIRKDNEGQAGQVEYGSRESLHPPEIVLTVQAPNQAPQVSAGSDQTIGLPDLASLNGMGSDDGLPSGSALAYVWSQVSGPGTATFALPNSATTSVNFSLPGAYVLRLATSDSELSATDDLNVVVNAAPPLNQAPQVNAGADHAITLPAMASLTGLASDDGLPAGSNLTVTWSKVSGPGTVTWSNPNTAVTSASFSDEGIYVLRLTASDSALNASDEVAVTVNPAGPQLPPDPVTVAPPLDRTVVTTLFAATEFLHSGTNPIQTGVAPGTITPIRSAVLRGRVITREGQPLPGVQITVANHPEFGQTLTRADGAFDLAVNGGGGLVVNYQKDDLLGVQRQVKVPWQRYVWVPPVAMIPLDSQTSVISLGSSVSQVHQSSLVTDADGSRRATLLFPAGTTATMELPTGTSQLLSTLQVRATEYTVGPNGPLAMPATLPANSFYTYCVEFSVDEAMAAGARAVRFSQPVIKYVDNFLG